MKACSAIPRLLCVTIAVILAQNFVLGALGVEIPKSLRGGIKVDQRTVDVALAMQEQGWVYHMPRPKSAQAAWGNSDGRTTWWVGYWTNSKTGETSRLMPIFKDGKFVGDGRGSPEWRRGGSPPRPNKTEWLLSKSGGIQPR